MHKSRIKDWSDQNKNKSSESMFKGSSDVGGTVPEAWWAEPCQGASICQNHTFQSCRNLLNKNFLLLLTLGGRLRQQEVQPLWEASSNHRSPFPCPEGSKNCYRLEKHLRLAWLAQRARTAPGRGGQDTVSRLDFTLQLSSQCLSFFLGRGASNLEGKGREVKFLMNFISFF